jgi:hypothetical protein
MWIVVRGTCDCGARYMWIVLDYAAHTLIMHSHTLIMHSHTLIMHSHTLIMHSHTLIMHSHTLSEASGHPSVGAGLVLV